MPRADKYAGIGKEAMDDIAASSTDISLRDRIAISAMNGFLAGGHYNLRSSVACAAYDLADEMLKVRTKGND